MSRVLPRRIERRRLVIIAERWVTLRSYVGTIKRSGR